MDQPESLQAPLLGNRLTKEAQYIYYNNIAILISTTSFFYNILEGAVSVYFGEVTDSISLFFFGVQSFVEVLSSIIVLWKVMTSYTENKHQIKTERRATVFIGCLFIFLAIGILITGILNLIDHSMPTTTIPNIIVSFSATVIMVVLYIIKKKLARELNSSTIQSDAQCSLACIRITVLLLIGSIIFHFWNGGWWIDGAMALTLGLLFGKEGIQMLRWAASKDFNGGCCGGCAKMPENPKSTVKVTCTTSLSKDPESLVQEPLLKKTGGCCKKGNCSEKKENKELILNDTETSSVLVSQGIQSAVSEQVSTNQAAKKCCKGGGCSKIAASQQPSPVEVITEEKLPPKSAGRCCKGGKCTKTPENQQTTQNQAISEIKLENIEPQLPSNEAVKKCCKGGACSKKSGDQKPAEPTIQAPIAQPNPYPLEDLKQEEVPAPKKTGCCSGGKCNKTPANQKLSPTEPTVQAPLAQADPYRLEDFKQEEVSVPKKTGCCSGGKCSKAPADQNVSPTEPAIQASVAQVNPYPIEDIKQEEVPVPKKTGCCSGGKCSKKVTASESEGGALVKNEEKQEDQVIEIKIAGDNASVAQE